MIFVGAVILLFLPSVLSCSETVTLDLSNPTYTFTSPNYPNPYPASKCTWMISAASAAYMTIYCPYFIVAQTINCGANYFVCTSAEANETFCGITSNLILQYTTNYLTIDFVSNLWWNLFYSGFVCTVSFTPKCICGVKNKGPIRIVGGEEAALHEFPWQAAIREKSSRNQFCGGSLISSVWIMTAAHCVNEVSGSSIIVSLGDHDKNSDYETDKTIHVQVSQIKVHESWDPETNKNDIALIKLINPVQLTREIFPICLPFNTADISGKSGTVIGWGKRSYEEGSLDILNKVEVDLLTASECRNKLSNSSLIADHMICAFKIGKDACQGDSGGPLFLEEGGNNFQVGIVSWGYHCGSDYPGVYTGVQSFLDWIQSETQEIFCVI